MNLNYEPRKRNAAPGLVARYFVVDPISGETYDGPFKKKAEAELSADLYRDRFGSEPKIVVEEIKPLSTNVSDPSCKGDGYW